MRRSITSVELSIDQMVLDGVEGVDGNRLRRSLERELGRLISERGTPPAWAAGASTATVTVPAVGWDGRGGEGGLASAIADALYDGLAR